MSEPAIATCEPWATEDDLCAPCADYESQLSAQFGWALQAASDVLFRLSGRQFPGLCSTTVRPCGMRAGDAAPPERHWRSMGVCGCAGDRCGCGLSRIDLGGGPIVSVDEVRVDGVAIDPTRYRVDGWRWLVRLPDADGKRRTWPTWQRLDRDDTEDETFSVTYTYGRTPPELGVRAAAALACELAMACNPSTVGDCRLPRKVQTIVRQGVTVVMSPTDFLNAEGLTGLVEVDLFLRAYNPQRITRRASVFSPDTVGSAAIVDT